MLSPGLTPKRRHAGAGFALGCGCKDAKSVSVSASVSATASPSAAGTSTTTTETRRRSAATNPSASTTDTLTLTSASSTSFLWEDAVAEFDCNDDGGFKLVKSSATTQSFSSLLRELNELEQSVVSWGRKIHRDNKLLTPPQENRKVKSGGKGGNVTTAGKDYSGGDSVEAGLDGSIAVVKLSEDPLSDFRESMLQIIVENGIVAREELYEMLRRFLTLNAPHHHDVILCAFTEIWDAVFEAASLGPVPATAAAPARSTRREPSGARPPMPRTPPRHRHRHPPSAWSA